MKLNNIECLHVGEYRISKFNEDSIFIENDEGEGMQINLDELWEEKF